MKVKQRLDNYEPKNQMTVNPMAKIIYAIRKYLGIGTPLTSMQEYHMKPGTQTHRSQAKKRLLARRANRH
jgi:hypothetical protein